MTTMLITKMRARLNPEDGITITEILVAFSLALIVILPMVLAMGNSFNTQSVNESRDRAVQIARGYIETSRQVTYSDLAFTDAQSKSGPLEGGTGGITTYNNEPIVVLPAGYTSSLDFSHFQEKSVGSNNFEVRTYITKVRNGTFDGTVSHLDATQIYPKRITVVVTWTTGNKEYDVVQTWVRSPDISECIPTDVLDLTTNNLAPIGCKI